MIDILSILTYTGISLITFIIFICLITIEFSWTAKKQKLSVAELLKKELINDNNLSLSIYVWWKLLAFWIIIAHTMALWYWYITIASILAYIIQIITIFIIWKLLIWENLTNFILEKQNVPVAILYSSIIISLSTIIWSVML